MRCDESFAKAVEISENVLLMIFSMHQYLLA